MAARAQGFNRLQRSIAKLRVGIAAGADPIPQAVVPFVAVLAARALDLRVTDLAFLPVLLFVVLDHGRMVELLRRLVLFIAAVQAPGELLARLLTGGGVLYKFKAMTFFDLFFAAGADLAVLLDILLDLLDLPVVRLRLCDGFLALEAKFVAHHAVLCLAVFRLRVLARAELAAAGADGLLCAVRTGDGLPLVRDVHRTVEHGHAERVFLIGAADVALIGQRIAQHQHVSVLQFVIGEGCARIICTAADRIQPAGAVCEVKLSDGGVMTAVQTDARQIDAAPERGIG